LSLPGHSWGDVSMVRLTPSKSHGSESHTHSAIASGADLFSNEGGHFVCCRWYVNVVNLLRIKGDKLWQSLFAGGRASFYTWAPLQSRICSSRFPALPDPTHAQISTLTPAPAESPLETCMHPIGGEMNMAVPNMLYGVYSVRFPRPWWGRE
jgi:hypothetical protein